MARLRRWLLVGVLVLVAVIAGLIGYTRYRIRHLIAAIPHQLGIDVKSETNGFTYSQSVKGRTLFTLHAAKAIQRENGKTTLHDVAITVYGPVGSTRQDSIRGAEFEYDQPNGIVRAAGEVHLDLAVPSEPAGPAPAPASAPKRIAVTTSGLVFLQKLGVAATEQPIHFVYGDLHGNATGADYDMDTGMLRLHSAVDAAGLQNGQPVELHAAAAELDRVSHSARLHTAQVRSQQTRAAGDTVLIATAKSGGIGSIHAEGHASIESEHDVRAQAPRMDAAMNGNGRPQRVVMSGGVHLQNAGGTGTAAEAVLRWNAAGFPEQADLQHAVHLEQTGPSGANNTITAEHVAIALTQDDQNHTQMREATATGGAVLHSVEPVTSAGRQGLRQTVVRAATLHALTATSGPAGARFISEIDGSGSTKIETDDGFGNLRTSSGDTLQAKLQPQHPATTTQAAASPASPVALTAAPTAAPMPGSLSAGGLQSAVQTGHVLVTQHAPAAPGKPAEDTRATAARAEFQQASQQMVLTGSPVVTGSGFQLAAARITMTQGSGGAEAEGGVTGTYLQTAETPGKTPEEVQGREAGRAPADPVHLLADHATVAGGGSTGRFYGGARPARMWTSTAQIEAPVIETERSTGRLLAHAATVSPATGGVRLVLPVAANNKAAGGSRLPAGASAIRITGGSLVYTPATAARAAHADVSGGVRMDASGGQLTADTAVATLASGGPGARRSAMLGGSVETVTATGNVHLQQPGRTGTGERLVYTAADSRYELTGTTSAPPRILDSLRGNLSGSSLIFHGGDDSVEVEGGPNGRVRTETDAGRSPRNR